jgi:hypothetical protein
MDDSKRIEKGFEVFVDATKLLISLSTGVVALTVAFASDLGEHRVIAVGTLGVAWLLYLASIFCGIMAVYSVVGTVTRRMGSTKDDPPGAFKTKHPTPDQGAIRFWAVPQWIFFVVATGLAGVYGLFAIQPKAPVHKSPSCVIQSQTTEAGSG